MKFTLEMTLSRQVHLLLMFKKLLHESTVRKRCVEATNIGSGFVSWNYHLLILELGACFLTFSHLSFLTCKMQVISIFTT
jgi:hypothetical protein